MLLHLPSWLPAEVAQDLLMMPTIEESKYKRNGKHIFTLNGDFNNSIPALVTLSSIESKDIDL